MEDKALKNILEKGILVEAPSDLQQRVFAKLFEKKWWSVKDEPLVTGKHWSRFMLALFGIAVLCFFVSLNYPSSSLSTYTWTNKLTVFSQSQITHWLAALIFALWTVAALDRWFKYRLNQKVY